MANDQKVTNSATTTEREPVRICLAESVTQRDCEVAIVLLSIGVDADGAISRNHDVLMTHLIWSGL